MKFNGKVLAEHTGRPEFDAQHRKNKNKKLKRMQPLYTKRKKMQDWAGGGVYVVTVTAV